MRNLHEQTGSAAVSGKHWIIGSLVQLFALFAAFTGTISTAMLFSGKGVFGAAFSVDLSVVSAHLDQAPDFPGVTWASYTEAQMESLDPNLVDARLYSALGTVIELLTFFVFVVTVMILAQQYKRQRPFTKAVRLSVIALSIGAFLSGFVSPILETLSRQRFVEVLQLPTHGVIEAGTEYPGPPVYLVDQWVVYPSQLLLQQTNWLLVGLGIVMAFMAHSFIRGEKLQEDTQGLV